MKSSLLLTLLLSPFVVSGAVLSSMTGRRALLPDNNDYVTVQLPKLNNKALEFAAQVEREGPFKFGEAVDMAMDVDADATKTLAKSVNGDYRVYRLGFASENAFSLNMIFDTFYLPDGAEMYIVGEKDTAGPFTSDDHQHHGGFATWPLEGSRVRIEVWVPVSSSEEPNLHLKSVVHGFRASGPSDSCNIDVKCPDSRGWEDQVRSSAMILTGGGMRFCSGAMINNAKNDGRQLFLTANHCVSGSWMYTMLMFNYERPACNSRTDGPVRDTVQGLKLLARYAPSDFALFEVIRPIPKTYNVYLSGFQFSNDFSVQSAAGIHHPSGDVKKFSSFSGELTVDCWAYSCEKKNHWKIRPWTRGTTEPGSSGSPLFNSNKLIIGQLHGGTASCGNSGGYDLYGGVFASWNGGGSTTNSLKAHLDPDNESSGDVKGANLNVLRQKSPSLLIQEAIEK